MRVFKVTHDYPSKVKYYLPIYKDDIILILEEHSSGWWTGQNINGDKGLIPSTYLENYNISSPSEELLYELAIMQTARNFLVDLTTHVPSPLNREEIFSWDLVKINKINFINLEKKIEELLISRETARESLKKNLKEFHNDINCKFQNKEKNGDSVELLKVNILKNQINVLDRYIKRTKKNLRLFLENKNIKKSSKIIKIHRIANDLIGEKLISNNKVELYREILIEQLHQSHENVHEAEMDLVTLSKNIQDLERLCKEGKAFLSYRIALRDAKIRALLNFWSDKAEKAKERYLQSKVQMHHIEAERRNEQFSLQQKIEIGKEKYVKLEDDFKSWKEKASIIKRKIEQKVILESLSQDIYRSKEEEIIWKEKILSIKK